MKIVMLIIMNKNQKIINMEESIRKSVGKDGAESITYRKEWKKDGLNFSKEVRKVEGGYIVRESKYGKPSDSEEYIDESKEYVTTENPIEEKKEETKMFGFLDTPSLF